MSSYGATPVTPIKYEDFQLLSYTWAAEGGAWQTDFQSLTSLYYPPNTPVVYTMHLDCCETKHPECCNETYLAVSIASNDFFGQPHFPSYTITASANISVSTMQYGNATSLDFTWAIWPTFIVDTLKTLEASSLPLHVQINDVGFDDTFAANASVIYQSTMWPYSPFSHNGTVSLIPGSDDGRSFISIVIKITTLATDGALAWDLMMKDITFNITTPTVSISPSSSNSSSSSPHSTRSMSTNGTLSTPTLTSSEFSITSSSSAIPSSASILSSSEAKVSPATIAGVAIGFGALAALLIALFFLYRRRRNSHALVLPPHEAISYPIEKHPLRGSAASSTESSILPYQIPVAISQDITSARPTLPPARSTYSAYGPGGSVSGVHELLPVYDDSPYSLALFASFHRELISEDLEARLEAAGYLPTVDPDTLTEEEWLTVHNVTKLEVMRLRGLYQRERQRANWQQPESISGGMR